MDPLTQYLEDNRDRFLEDLKAVLRIASVSADPSRKAEVARCADHVAAHLKSIGMTKAEVVATAGHPVVYAEWLGAPGKPTILLYGHYDVQPTEGNAPWVSPPFEPVVKDGKIYARGACDDKGQVYMHLSAIAAHFAVNKKLPVNLKVMIEGEEEVGSEHLEAFIKSRRSELDADVIVVSDTSMPAADQPGLCYALRGISYAQIEVTGPTRDLHSGEFGGAVMNPANALCGIIAALRDANGKATLPGFYDDVRELSAAERTEYAKTPFHEADFIRESGAPEAYGERGYSTLERISTRPTLDVNGMWSGYTGPGSKTVLPSFAGAKVSMRLVPDQDPNKIFAALETYVKKIAPPQVTVKVMDLHGAVPFITRPDHPSLEAARRALARSWTKPPVMIREGGSIPIMSTFQRTHGLPCILMGFGLHDDQVHAPNEKFSLTSFHGGTTSCAYLYEEVGKLAPEELRSEAGAGAKLA